MIFPTVCYYCSFYFLLGNVLLSTTCKTVSVDCGGQTEVTMVKRKATHLCWFDKMILWALKVARYKVDMLFNLFLTMWSWDIGMLFETQNTMGWKWNEKWKKYTSIEWGIHLSKFQRTPPTATLMCIACFSLHSKPLVTGPPYYFQHSWDLNLIESSPYLALIYQVLYILYFFFDLYILYCIFYTLTKQNKE